MHHHLSLRSKIIVMVSVMAAMFLVSLDQTIISTALGKIVEDFNAFSSLSWIVTAYLLTTTITVPIAGKLSDLFGRRTLLLIGVGIFGAASLMSGLAANVTELVAWRAVQGIGGGIITANAFTIVGDLFAARERGRWQGMIGAVFGLSALIGPLLGGFLTDGHSVFGLVTTDWRWTFFINVPIALAALVVIAIFCPPLKHAQKPRVDYAGAALLSVGLALLVLAVDNTESIFAGLLDTTGMSLGMLRTIMLSLFALITAAFVAVELRTKEPILPMRFFKNGSYVRIIVIAMLFGAAFMGSILYLTQFNQQVFGASPTKSGLMLLPMVAGIMASSITSGRLISKTGRYKRFMVGGLVLSTAAMLMLSLLTPESHYWQEAIVIVLLGLGMGSVMPVINLAVQNEFPQRDLGVATSSAQLFRSLGSTIGTAAFGALLTAGIVAQLGSVSNGAYVRSLSSNEQVQKIGSLEDTDTLLTLNMPDIKRQITDGAEAAFAQLPAEQRAAATENFLQNQSEFSYKITHAFSDSLQRIFLVAFGLMFVATVTGFTLREKRLKTALETDTPGETPEQA